MNKHLDQNISIDSTQEVTAPEQHLILVRAIWCSVALLAFGLISVGVPERYAQLSTVAPGANTLVGQLRPEEAYALEQAGISIPMYAIYLAALDTLFTLLFVSTGLALAWLRPKDRAALLISLSFIGLGLTAITVGMTQPRWYPAFIAVRAVWYASSVPALYLFPNGRFVPRWTRWLTVCWLIYTVCWLIFPAISPPFGFSQGFTGSELPRNLWMLLWICSGLAAQIYRYRHVSNAMERQQVKWVEFGFGSFVILWIIGASTITLTQLAPMEGTIMIAKLAGTSIVLLGEIIAPLSLGISILRYQLFDIDILINRTLVYGALTASVVGLYVLIVGGFGILFQMQNSLSSIFIAILCIAFLFQPLRRRLQSVADRFVPMPKVIIRESMPAAMPDVEPRQKVPGIDGAPNTAIRGHWLLIARLAWLIGFVTLTLMYALGFLAAYDAFSTVCKEELCTLGQQIRHTEAGDQVISWPGPPIGYADRLHQDQVAAIERFGLTLDQYGWLATLQVGLSVLVFLLIAAGLFWQKSDDWMVLFASIMVATIPVGNGPLLFILVVRQPAWEWVSDLVGVVALSCFLIFPLIFPTGRFVPRWTRWMALFEIAGAVIILFLPDSILEGTKKVIAVYVATSFVTGIYAQLYRYFRVASPVERQQLKWVIVGLAGFISITLLVLLPLNALLVYWTTDIDLARTLALSVIPDTLFQVILLFIPLSIALSVLRYRLWDIDIIISRTLVYGTLTVGIIALYVLLVGALSLLSQTTGNLLISLLATGLIAFLFQPLRERLQRGVNRLVYGERDDPYVALSRLGRRLEASLAPEAVLPTVITTIRDVLRLPYVAIYLKQEGTNKIVAESASPSLRSENGRIVVPGMNREGLCMPLIHQGETLGYIVLGPRAPNEAFGSMDLHLLEDLATQVGVAVHAVRLTSDLQRSREQLVLAREEERRRLRRDLHDDLGPTLASLGLAASTAADLIPTNPAIATKLVKELESQIRATVGNVRRLVYDLRPPTLDELGLLAAVRERAARYSNAPDGFQVAVDAPAELPPLPAAVEVAAYRIVQEALENVSKHSQARQCTIRFANHNGLEVEVTDDGIGMPPNITPGVGLRSMRERADELGGSCMIERGKSGGTRVWASLPFGEYDGTFANPDRG